MWLHAEEPQISFEKIQKLKYHIMKASEIFEINASILASIIYSERTLNFNWDDEVFVEYLAEIGYNSSIGFCQIKIKTAFFIEMKMNQDKENKAKYGSHIKLSKTKKDLIEKLYIDSINITYAAAYVKLIEDYWSKKKFPIRNKPEIIGTLYSIGLFNKYGIFRAPHFFPKPNLFGEKVLESIHNFYF